MSSPMEAYLRKGNKVLDIPELATSSDVYRARVHNPHFRPGECELLTVRSKTEAQVLIGGSVVVVHVLEGTGILETIELKTGESRNALIEAGSRLHISAENIAFSYQNLGKDALSLGSTCLGFNHVNQPPATEVVQALTKVLLG